MQFLVFSVVAKVFTVSMNSLECTKIKVKFDRKVKCKY